MERELQPIHRWISFYFNVRQSNLSWFSSCIINLSIYLNCYEFICYMYIEYNIKASLLWCKTLEKEQDETCQIKSVLELHDYG